MPFKKSVIFPDYVFEGQLEVPTELNKEIQV
jgi:hypothetical protein